MGRDIRELALLQRGMWHVRWASDARVLARAFAQVCVMLASVAITYRRWLPCVFTARRL